MRMIYFSDGIHPTKVGHGVMGDLAAPVIASA